MSQHPQGNGQHSRTDPLRQEMEDLRAENEAYRDQLLRARVIVAG